MKLPAWMYKDPQKVVEYKEDGIMMQDSKVRQWAKNLSNIHDRGKYTEYLDKIPEQYREAVRKLARSK